MVGVSMEGERTRGGEGVGRRKTDDTEEEGEDAVAPETCRGCRSSVKDTAAEDACVVSSVIEQLSNKSVLSCNGLYCAT